MEYIIDTRNKKQIFIGILIVIVVIYLGTIYYNFTMIDDLMGGFWVAPPDFCVDAGLDSMVMYIGEKPYFSSHRPCYILIQRNGEIFLNEPTELSIAWSWFSIQNWRKCLDHSTVKYGTVSFDIPNNIGFPSTQDLACYPTYGKMVLSYGDKLHAVLYRSSELTETSLDQQKATKIMAPAPKKETISEPIKEDVETLE
jgi:hypothetical protein